MVGRAATVWFLLLIIAVVSGTLRVAILTPRLGEQQAHVVGTLVVSAVFAAVIWATVQWIVPSLDPKPLLALGVGWLVATVTFEFLFGHYVAGHPWTVLLADYDVVSGRLWPLVLVVVAAMPTIAGLLRRPAEDTRP